MTTNDWFTMIHMLDSAEVRYEIDEKTYAPRVKVIRVLKFNMRFQKDVVVTIFDFDFFGNLLSIN